MCTYVLFLNVQLNLWGLKFLFCPYLQVAMFDPDDPGLADFFADASYLEEGGCADCPPPRFQLPPPPRPPHLGDQEACSLLVPSIDTCDNILIRDGQVRSQLGRKHMGTGSESAIGK